MNPYNMAIPTRPAATATPAPTTVMSPDVAGDLGAAPSATADAVADASAELADEPFELKEAEASVASGRAALTSLVYISMSRLPTLLQ